MRLPLALLALAALLVAPTAAACEGLSPGDRIVSDGASCTLAFLLANPDGLYFATAGHCVKTGAAVTSDGHGEIGTAVVRHLDPDTGQSTDGSPGQDFALIKIHPSLYAQLNPKMCGWNGPTGIVEDDSADGGNVQHYGYGMIVGESESTRKREGYNAFNDGPNYAFYWAGAGVPGDSGSGVLAADGRALGVLTHLLVRPPDTNGGTHLLRGYEIAKEQGVAGLRLVLMGEDPVAVLASLQGSPPAPTPPHGTMPPPTTATPPGSGGNATQPPEATPTNATPPASDPIDPAGDDTSAPGATLDEKGVPTPGVALALLAVGLAAIARRGRREQR